MRLRTFWFFLAVPVSNNLHGCSSSSGPPLAMQCSWQAFTCAKICASHAAQVMFTDVRWIQGVWLPRVKFLRETWWLDSLDVCQKFERDTGIRIYWKKKCRKYHRLMALVDPFSLVRQPTRPGGFLPHFPAAGPVYAAIPAQHRLHSELWLEHRWKDCHHPTAGLGPERPPAPRWYRMGWWHSGWALAPMKDVLASLLWCRWVPATSRSNAYGVQDSMLWKRYS